SSCRHGAPGRALSATRSASHSSSTNPSCRCCSSLSRPQGACCRAHLGQLLHSHAAGWRQLLVAFDGVRLPLPSPPAVSAPHQFLPPPRLDAWDRWLNLPSALKRLLHDTTPDSSPTVAQRRTAAGRHVAHPCGVLHATTILTTIPMDPSGCQRTQT